MRAGHTIKVALGAAVAVFLMGLTLAGSPAGAQGDEYADVLTSTADQTTVGSTCNNTGITVTTSNLLPGTDATFTLFSDPVVLGTVVADDDGNASITFDLPAGTTLGQHQLVTSGTNEFGVAEDETIVLTVVSCAGTGGTGGTGGDGLARTGTDVSTPVRAAVLVFAAGAALLLVSRKRQARPA
ncbi:MAG TPA: hypothetical protein VF228_00305 [Iamia sp.]